MSLVKSPRMTEKKGAANRCNQALSHVPQRGECGERVRAALLRSGFSAQAEETAMRALGEEPAHFQDLLEVLWEEWNPAGGLPEGVVIRLARAMWLMNRADRMQEGYAVRQATEVSTGRDDRLHVQMMRLKMTEDSLRLLVQSVAREHYVTTSTDLEKIKNLHQEGVLKDMGEIALALFYQLQAPGTDESGLDECEKARMIVRQVKDIFGITPEPEDEPANSTEALEEGGTGNIPTSPRQNGRVESGRASFWRISSGGRRRLARRGARPPGRSPGLVPRPMNAPRKSRPPTPTLGSCRECRIPTFGKCGGSPA